MEYLIVGLILIITLAPYLFCIFSFYNRLPLPNFTMPKAEKIIFPFAFAILVGLIIFFMDMDLFNMPLPAKIALLVIAENISQLSFLHFGTRTLYIIGNDLHVVTIYSKHVYKITKNTKFGGAGRERFIGLETKAIQYRIDGMQSYPRNYSFLNHLQKVIIEEMKKAGYDVR